VFGVSWFPRYYFISSRSLHRRQKTCHWCTGQKYCPNSILAPSWRTSRHIWMLVPAVVEMFFALHKTEDRQILMESSVTTASLSKAHRLKIICISFDPCAVSLDNYLYFSYWDTLLYWTRVFYTSDPIHNFACPQGESTLGHHNFHLGGRVVLLRVTSLCLQPKRIISKKEEIPFVH
jgi:hypothetical protein